MSGYLSYMYAAAHDAEIGVAVERARPARERIDGARPARPTTSLGRPRRLRLSLARFLLGLALRLDHGLPPATVRPTTCGPHI